MHRREGILIVSATDLVGFLECGHLTLLDRAAAAGLLAKPVRGDDPAVELLQWRGGEHEKRYIAQLTRDGTRVTDLKANKDLSYTEQAAATEAAMRRGDKVIYQGTVFDGRWLGYPDFLLRKDGLPPSASRVHVIKESPERDSGPVGETLSAGASGAGLGYDWHYEVGDTKLAHSAKASALIQIASYVEHVERVQGVRPENVYVVTGGAEIEVRDFRTADMMAYFRRAKRRFEESLDEASVGPATYPIPRGKSYPDPVEHCAVCRWVYVECKRVWHQDDALPLVAGISRKQRGLLTANSIATMTALSELTSPIHFEGMKPAQSDSMWEMREQARLQETSKGQDVPVYELLEPERNTAQQIVTNRGLAALPPPSKHDLFFDIEGDPFALWEGMEYLFGIWDGAAYSQYWAMNRDEENLQFQQVVDRFHEHWKLHPEMHVYHYGVYEPSRLKQLAGRHATRQEQLDELLTANVFVDLYRVVRQGLRVGTERYSIKNLEDLYGFTREIELRDANSSIVEFEKMLEIGDPSGELKELIAGYNRDDCVSTQLLRDWLEKRRPEAALKFGEELPRPRKEPDPVPKPQTQWEAQLSAVTARLTDGLPTDPEEVDQNPRAKATWLLANLLDWHRREDKASWWRFFELMTLSDEELLLEQEPIAGLVPDGLEVRDNGKKVFRYSFPPQEHKVGNRSDLFDPRLPPFDGAQVKNGGIDKNNLKLSLVRDEDWEGPHPTSVVPKDRIPFEGFQQALLRFAEWVADNGIDADGADYRAARDLLLLNAPRTTPEVAALPHEGEPGRETALALAPELDSTTLAIQGPPGSGKTTTGTQMILELVRGGCRVGITGPSHKVVSNLLEKVCTAASNSGIELKAIQRGEGDDMCDHALVTLAKDNPKLDRLMADDSYRVIAGTTWAWARENMANSVDTLFVDEAGQLALASVVAAGRAARNIVLLGDPQQLEQVLQGSHPPGAERSALGHFLGKANVIEPSRGVFLEKTYRMHPQITAFTSDLFYADSLRSSEGLEHQRVVGDDDLAGSGIRWITVEHDGNTNGSSEEAREVARIVRTLIGREWVNEHGDRAVIGGDDILIVSPFNAHRLLVGAELEKLGLGENTPLVGTVDKFQGQQAAISIFTMATSRPEDAPRGLDFLFSLNRLNVATSRARALAIVVGSPLLLSAVAHSPEQLREVNALCALVEFAQPTSDFVVVDDRPPAQLAFHLT